MNNNSKINSLNNTSENETKNRSSAPSSDSEFGGSRNQQWFAFYTKPRAEKKAYNRLLEQGYNVYLPLVKTLRQWSDRKKMVEIPLIPSYLFVKTHISTLHEIIQIDGILSYIKLGNNPSAIPEYQINNLKLLVNSEERIEITGEKLDLGDEVEVTHGSLKGIRGRLVKIHARNKVAVQIERLDLNLIVTIQKAFLRKYR